MLILTAAIAALGVALCMAALRTPLRKLHVVIDRDDDEGELHVRLYAGGRLVRAVTDPDIAADLRTPSARFYVLHSGRYDEHQDHTWVEQVAAAAQDAPVVVRAYLASRVEEYHRPVSEGCSACLAGITGSADKTS